MTNTPSRRAFLLPLVRQLPWAVAGVLAVPRHARAQPHWTVPREQLQERVAQRFPLRYPVHGLLDLTVRTPVLSLLHTANRLGAAMVVDAAGPALRRAHAGQLALDFALRYEPSDRTLRAHQVRLVRLDFPTLAPAVVQGLQQYGPALVQQALHEVVLHRAQPQELALLDTLGLQPGPMVITPEGVRVDLVRATPSNPS